MIANSNTMIAKIFAALAVAGLVVGSFAALAPVAGAQTTTTTTTTTGSGSSTTANVTFTNDLTIGSTGAAVSALQAFLIAKGYSIPAGATGYFGTQTKAALASYQAANGIAPAVGYFGPITRAQVNATTVNAGGSTGGTGTGTGTGSTSGLSGGEANLTDFDLVREESDGNEGEEEVPVFTVEFDVEDGDVRVERMEITASSTIATAGVSKNPWDYFDRVSIWVDGDEVADMDVDSRDDWDETTDDVYELTLTGLDIVVEEGDMAEITVAFDIAGTIDTTDLTQNFDFKVLVDGIRAVDAEGIQQYTGSNTEKVSFGFNEEQNGDLSVKTSSADPDSAILVADADRESQEYTVFVFDIDNDEDADSLITDLQIDVTDGNASVATADIIRRATLVVNGDEFDGDIAGLDNAVGTIDFDDIDVEIGGDDELEFELMITLARNATSTTLSFEVDGATDVDAEGLDSGDETVVDGSATSATHTTALTGIVVEAVSTSQSVTTPGQTSSSTYGTYTIRFDVTAIEEDAFVTNSGATSTNDGIEYDIFGSATSTTYTGTASVVLTSTADLVSGRYQVDEGATETFTLTVTLDPAVAGTYGVRLDEVNFNKVNAAGNTVFTVDASNQDYRTDAVYIAN